MPFFVPGSNSVMWRAPAVAGLVKKNDGGNSDRIRRTDSSALPITAETLVIPASNHRSTFCKAMPYVPPHLRGQSAQGNSDSISSTARSSSHDNLSSFDRGSGSRWGSDSGAARRPNIPRTPSANNIDSRSTSRRSAGPAEAIIGKWQPSDRVKALDADQIADIRQRLNVDVEVPDGQPPAWPPIESFKDMVSSWHF